jgi:hypothetical protein
VNRPWRKVKVTERRAAEDFAACMRELTDVHYPKDCKIGLAGELLHSSATHVCYTECRPIMAVHIFRRDVTYHWRRQTPGVLAK